MSNIDLNVGGMLGAVVGGIVVGAIVFAVVGVPDGGGRGPYRLIILGLIGGGFAGNYVWGMVFKKREPPPDKLDI